MSSPIIKKPCIALMGEFSAGKSTLANLLIGYDPLPVQVIATQLPPVRIVYGEGAPFQMNLDGERSPIDLAAIDRDVLEEVAYIQIYSQEELLTHCDLLDMPGISDPNMPAEVWERMIGEADGVLWCSPATQAWRQSEAAVWASLPEELRSKSLLLLTRIDKLTSQTDRIRVLQRVKDETADLFADVLPISLTMATREKHDVKRWQASGAQELAEGLIAILGKISNQATHETMRNVRLPAFERPQQPATLEDELDDFARRVVPKRPPVREARTIRPI